MAPNKEKWMAENISAWKKAKKEYNTEELETAKAQLEAFFDSNDWTTEPEVLAKPPRILSRRAIIEKTAALGIWVDIKALITSLPLGEDLFFASNDIAENHPMYQALKPTLEQKLTESGVTDIEAWLDSCILERY